MNFKKVRAGEIKEAQVRWGLWDFGSYLNEMGVMGEI